MLKRILILLDETPSSAAARHYAFRLAQRMNAEVTALAGVDLPFIEAPLVGAVEGELKKQIEDSRKRLRDAYEQECQICAIPFEWLTFNGEPITILSEAAETRDLIVTGHDTAFRLDMNEKLSEFLSKLLQITPRPVIVCPEERVSGEAILIAYDGSVPSMRAIQIFALLGIGRDRPVYVASVDACSETAARRASGAASYLRTHGYEAEACPTASAVHPADLLRIEAANRGAGTLVMEAYGSRGFREFLFGSTTSALVERPPCPLFVYH